MRYQEIVTGTALAALGVAAFLHAGATLPFRAGLMPRAVAVLLAVLGLLLALRGLRRAVAHTGPAAPVVAAPGRLALAVGVTAVFLLAVPAGGFALTSAVFIVGLGFLAGYRRPLPLILGAVAFVGGAHLVFREMFSLRLPQDVLLRALWPL